MAFDRHQILFDHYAAQIAGEWRWKKIVDKCKANAVADDYSDGTLIGRCYLGTVFSIMPSGKYYMPWCTNQTRADEIKDAAYMEALEAAADEHGLWIESGEDDPCDLFACMAIDDAPADDEATA